MSSFAHSPLGQTSPFVSQYDATLLYPMARATQREKLGLGKTLPFLGAD